MSDGTGSPQPAAVAVLAVVIVALLAAGGIGVATHHSDSKSPAAVIPAAFQRVIDQNDHVSFAVPEAWRVRVLPGGPLSSQVQALKVTDPQLAGLASLASTSGTDPRLGVVATDPTSRTTLVTLSFDGNGIKKVSKIPVSSVEDPLIQAGAKNIEAVGIHMPVGDGEQVSNQLPVGTTTVSEVSFYFVHGGRVVEVVLVSLQSQPPKALAQQIEGSVAAA
ncbi:MAG: hypothetical protein QOF30_177 [Acidimicrobiaceae bacterium]|jgi:hypothetical protein|nr:hypothetical protein [Acidimicrobiaceae bacterium]